MDNDENRLNGLKQAALPGDREARLWLGVRERIRVRNSMLAMLGLSCLALAIMIGFNMILRNLDDFISSVSRSAVMVTTSSNSKASVSLHDGTLVRLNARTSLAFDGGFGKAGREVSLDGEGYFEVSADKQRPFTVQTQRMDVTALGTKFNVFAHSGKEESEMTLSQGHVIVSTPKGNVDVIPNEKVTVDNEGSIRKEATDGRLETGWLDRTMVFEHDRLDFVLKTVGRLFDAEIPVPYHLDPGDLYSGSFDNPSLKEILEILGKHYDCTFSVKNPR
ncbi:MAG: FecR domain-containing protein [Bacteroidales bacterium]|nr:FecR domain-containing protein [Bacteroidales bacterium]